MPTSPQRSRRGVRRLATLALCALAMLLVACGDEHSENEGTGAAATSGEQQVEQLTINFFQGTDTSLPIAVADEVGLWEEYGLSVTAIPSANGPIAMSALLSGDADLVMNQTPAFFDLMQERGSNLKAVVGNQAAYPFSLMVGPDVQTSDAGYPEEMRALKGKVFGVDAIGGVTYSVVRTLFREAGMNPDQDVKFVAIGNPPELAAALGAGQVDAFFALPAERVRLEANNEAKVLFSLTGEGAPPFFEPWILNEYVGLASNLEQKQGTIERFQDAYAGILEYMRDPANREQVLDTATTSMNVDRETAQRILEIVLPTFDAEIDPQAIKNVSTFLVENELLNEPVTYEEFVWQP